MRIPELRYGPLEEVSFAVDLDDMGTDELRSVILNLIDHIVRIEKRLDVKEPA